ncbi:hypothetical protein ACKWTF_009597 [Chironomus riparius]
MISLGFLKFAVPIYNLFFVCNSYCLHIFGRNNAFQFNRSEMREADNNKVKIGPKSVKITCVHCSTIIKTDIVSEPSMMTHSASIMLIPFCCCCLPYCCKSCNDVLHYCPRCKEYIETYRRY